MSPNVFGGRAGSTRISQPFFNEYQLADEARVARSLRRGILFSMRAIRTQLMVRGEWDDPTVLPLDVIATQLDALPHRVDLGISAWAQHEHSIRWTCRQVRKAQAARGDAHN